MMSLQTSGNLVGSGNDSLSTARGVRITTRGVKKKGRDLSFGDLMNPFLDTLKNAKKNRSYFVFSRQRMGGGRQKLICLENPENIDFFLFQGNKIANF